MKKFTILIDGGFLKPKLGTRSNPVSADKVYNFIESLNAHPELKNMGLYRVFFYDAPPFSEDIEKPLTNGKVEKLSNDPLTQANLRLINELAKKPYVAIRKGECVFRGWKLRKQVLRRADNNKQTSIPLSNDMLMPNIQQKGVDMRIGLDIAALTLKKIVDVIVLVTGDSDFIPAVKFARTEGCQVFLVNLNHSVRDDLLHHTDLVLDIPL